MMPSITTHITVAAVGSHSRTLAKLSSPPSTAVRDHLLHHVMRSVVWAPIRMITLPPLIREQRLGVSSSSSRRGPSAVQSKAVAAAVGVLWVVATAECRP